MWLLYQNNNSALALVSYHRVYSTVGYIDSIVTVNRSIPYGTLVGRAIQKAIFIFFFFSFEKIVPSCQAWNAPGCFIFKTSSPNFFSFLFSVVASLLLFVDDAHWKYRSYSSRRIRFSLRIHRSAPISLAVSGGILNSFIHCASHWQEEKHWFSLSCLYHHHHHHHHHHDLDVCTPNGDATNASETTTRTTTTRHGRGFSSSTAFLCVTRRGIGEKASLNGIWQRWQRRWR